MRLTKYHTMKTYGTVQGQLHAFLTSALGEGEWSASHPGLPFFSSSSSSDAITY
jgi:hypothetical protein